MYVPGGVLLSIILEANFTNRPNNSGIIYGVSQETIQSIVRSFAREKSEQHGCRIEVVRFNAASYGNILIIYHQTVRLLVPIGLSESLYTSL